MEDHNQSRNQTNSADKEDVLELSAEMALLDQKKHKIIELTEDIDDPTSQEATQPIEPSPKEGVTDISESTLPDDHIDPSTPSVTDVEDIPATSEIAPPAAIHHETKDTIENEVDAAFEAVAVPPQEATPPAVDDLLFDELSDITQEVDEAVGKSDLIDPTDEDQPPPAGDALLDGEDLSAQAAELDAAMAGGYDDDTISPLNIEEQEENEIANDIEEMQDDDIIELRDVVDPAELDHSEAEATEENDIIELTQIVDIAEIESLEAKEAPRLADAQPADDAEVAKGYSREEELTLSRIDDGSDFTGDIEASAETDDIFNTAELDGLFDDDVSEDNITEAVSSPSEIDDGSDFTDDIEASADTDDTFDNAELDGLFDNDIPEDNITEAMGLLSDDIAIASDPEMEDANGLFDIVDDFDRAQSPEEETVDDIESIPSMEETEGLFDIEDQINASQISEEPSPETMDTAPIASPEEETEEQEQVIHLTDILSTSRAQRPPAENAPDRPEADMDTPSVDLETETRTDIDSTLADDTPDDDALFEDKKIEAAVEKIIRTKYADKMEQLIASAVEKAVTQEIENIKRTLSDNDEPQV